MDSSHGTAHGAHDEEHGVHLPDPSIWPLIVGVAALLVGAAIVWWSRDRGNDFTGPFLGVAITFLFVAVAGWATEDSRMRRKAETSPGAGPRNVRFTQVVTFAVAEGQLDRARSNSGIITALDQSNLRDLAGFQDLRITVSPATAGPSQVLIETTWSGRDGLATYEESRQTLLDLITNHPDEVVPGSVQVFDMEVVRDTKDVGFRFGLPAALTVIGGLAVGGFMIGAGLTAFQESGHAAGGETVTPAPEQGLAVTATDNKFDKTSVTVPPNTDVTLTFNNKGKVKHNIHFLDKAGGNTLAPGAEGAILDGGGTEALTFKTPAPGTYYFQCDLHPDQMNGQLIVQEGATVPGAGGASGGGGAGAAAGNTLIATDNKFDKTSLQGTAGQEFSLNLDNKGKVKHNVHFLDKKGGNTLAPGAEGAILDGGKSEVLKFTPSAPGTYYYQCDLHPDQMSGTFTVK